MNEQIQTELKKILMVILIRSTRSNYARGEDTYDPILSQAASFRN